jgi:quercetin dioxygenase-like cupin family protein
MEPVTSATPTLLTAEAIASIAAAPLDSIEGVTNRVLWRDDTSMAGLLTVEGGHRLGAHAHRMNHHHIWVLDGRASILGTEVGPGSYVHIPSGVEHDIDASRSSGCTVYYLYLRPPP